MLSTGRNIECRIVGQPQKKNIGKYSMIQKDGLNFVRLYFLNYTWYVNDLHNIRKRRS